MRIEKLTPEQEAKVVEWRERFFAQATSTERADRPRADAAARRLAEIGGVKVNNVVWAASVVDGQKAYEAAWASLRDSLGDSLWDSGWTAFYAFGRELGVEYDPKYAEILELHEEIGASCFALWIVPGTVILCERPSKCEIVGGRLVNIEWKE